jgi:hypothetical protein
LNGAGDKGHGTREGLSYRQIVRWATIANSEWRVANGEQNSRGERQFALRNSVTLLEWLSATTEKAVNGE